MPRELKLDNSSSTILFPYIENNVSIAAGNSTPIYLKQCTERVDGHHDSHSNDNYLRIFFCKYSNQVLSSSSLNII